MSSSDDTLLRFLLPSAGVRGVAVRLDASWQTLAERSCPPAATVELLGQACAASVLLTAHVKIKGRLSLQLRGGPIATLFAECTADGAIRGIVRLREGETVLPPDLRMLGKDALLAITIENPGLTGHDGRRQVGMVRPAGARLDAALEAYFLQSEQLHTRLHLACNTEVAAGLLLQKLPGPSDDADGYPRASALFETLRDDELFTLAPMEIVHRLFHEEAPQLLGESGLHFGCSCSRERVADVLIALGREEAEAAVAAGGGQAIVDCEFCGQTYSFDADAIAALFARQAGALPGAPGLQ